MRVMRAPSETRAFCQRGSALVHAAPSAWPAAASCTRLSRIGFHVSSTISRATASIAGADVVVTTVAALVAAGFCAAAAAHHRTMRTQTEDRVRRTDHLTGRSDGSRIVELRVAIIYGTQTA